MAVISSRNAATDALLWITSSKVSGTEGRSTSKIPARMSPIPASASNTGISLATR